MDTDRIVRESRTIMIATLLIGFALLAVGLVSSTLALGLTPNDRAVTGLSFIPLAVALFYYVKMTRIVNSPQSMRKVIVEENDERLVALKNEAEAKTLRVVNGVLFLTYMGYTLMVPADVFEAVGWWILLGLLFVSFASQAVLTQIITRRERARDDEER